MDVKECYRVLELEIGASRDAVEAAYFRQMERWRPDRAAASGGGLEAVQEANRMVEKINEAYRALDKIVPATGPADQPPTPAPAAKPKAKISSLAADPIATPATPAPPPSAPPPAAAKAAAPAPAPAPRAPEPAPAPAPAPTGLKPTPPASATNAMVALAQEKFAALPPKQRLGVIIAAAVALLFLVITVGKWATPDKRRVEAPDPKTVGRMVVKSNLASTVVEATRLPATGEKASSTVHGPADGAAQQTLPDLAPGKYSLVTHATGWPDLSQEVTVTAGQVAEVAVNFKVGSLRLDSVPTGATVRQGETVLGRTPLVVPQLPPGECQLLLEYPAWPSLPFKATIVEGVETAATARLPHGRLVVETTPAGATVLFAGRPIGQTPLTIERFQAGTKKLTLQTKEFPPLEITVTMEDRGEAKFSLLMAEAFPVLDPNILLSTVWIETVAEDKDRLSPAFTQAINFRPKNGIVRNLNRKMLFEKWLDRKYRYTGTVKLYDNLGGKIEFAEQPGANSKYRVVAQLSTAARSDPALAAQLTKGATFALYGRLSAVEEPSWPSKVITLEFSAAEPQR